MTKVAASILSADLANLQNDCTRLLDAGADLMHFDVMDLSLIHISEPTRH